MLENPEINSIIVNLQEKGIIDKSINAAPDRSGTTEGLVYILSEDSVAKFVLKIDRPQQTTVVEQFIKTYNHINLLPKILYTDPAKTFIITTYGIIEVWWIRGTVGAIF